MRVKPEAAARLEALEIANALAEIRATFVSHGKVPEESVIVTKKTSCVVVILDAQIWETDALRSLGPIVAALGDRMRDAGGTSIEVLAV